MKVEKVIRWRSRATTTRENIRMDTMKCVSNEQHTMWRGVVKRGPVGNSKPPSLLLLFSSLLLFHDISPEKDRNFKTSDHEPTDDNRRKRWTFRARIKFIKGNCGENGCGMCFLSTLSSLQMFSSDQLSKYIYLEGTTSRWWATDEKLCEDEMASK